MAELVVAAWLAQILGAPLKRRADLGVGIGRVPAWGREACPMLRFGSDLWVVLVLVLVGGRGVGWGGTGGAHLFQSTIARPETCGAAMEVPLNES
jgi:hypothetical protein